MPPLRLVAIPWEVPTSRRAPLEPEEEGRKPEWFEGGIGEGTLSSITAFANNSGRIYLCVLAPNQGQGWLALSKPEGAILKPLPKGTLSVRTLRRDGKDLVA